MFVFGLFVHYLTRSRLLFELIVGRQIELELSSIRPFQLPSKVDLGVSAFLLEVSNRKRQTEDVHQGRELVRGSLRGIEDGQRAAEVNGCLGPGVRQYLGRVDTLEERFGAEKRKKG